VTRTAKKPAPVARPKTLPVTPLTAAQDRERLRNLASVRAQRNALTVGEMRPSNEPCKQGHERVNVLVAIESGGGQTWRLWCWTCFPDAPNDW
jgi:hypothetical protein